MYAKTIVVVGGTSFVGSHFVHKLCLFSNYRIIVIDNDSYNLEKVKDQILIEKDIYKIFDQYQIDVVFDFSENDLYNFVNKHKTLYIKFSNNSQKYDILIQCATCYGPKIENCKISKWIINAINQDFLYVNELNVLNLVYVEDVCDAIIKVFHFGKRNSIYTITGYQQKEVEFVRTILKKFELPMTMIEYITSDLDKKYDICPNLSKLCWRPKVNIDIGLNLTIKWFKGQQN